MKKYDEFTKLSIHNHFGSKDSEKKIDEPFNKIMTMDYDSVIKRLDDAEKNDFELLVLTNANTFKVADYFTTFCEYFRVHISILAPVLVIATGIPNSLNLLNMYFEISKVKSFSIIPFPLAPGSSPPCPGSITIFAISFPPHVIL